MPSSVSPPRVVLLAGPNGAGKTTVSRTLVCDQLGIRNFVNADTIARGLAGFDPESVAIAAGRVMLARLLELAKARADFAFETNLASRSLVPWLRGLRETGYQVSVAFLWLPSADVAVARVAQRVATGGHHVPEPIVRRRFERGITNLRGPFQHLASELWLFDSARLPPRLVASGPPTALDVLDPETVRKILGTPP